MITIIAIHRYYSWGGGTSWNGISGFGSWWVCACGLSLRVIHRLNSPLRRYVSFLRRKIWKQYMLFGIIYSFLWVLELSKNPRFFSRGWFHLFGLCWFLYWFCLVSTLSLPLNSQEPWLWFLVQVQHMQRFFCRSSLKSNKHITHSFCGFVRLYEPLSQKPPMSGVFYIPSV